MVGSRVKAMARDRVRVRARVRVRLPSDCLIVLY